MGWKWKKWRDLLPHSSCFCFGRKEWNSVADDDDSQGKVQQTALIDEEGLLLKMKKPAKVIDLDTWPRSRCIVTLLSQRSTHGIWYSSMRVKQENSSSIDDYYGAQAKCLLSRVGEWDFNVFNLDRLTNGRALFHLGLHLFQEHGLIGHFQLDIVKLMRCFTLIEDSYHGNNPYHNARHAADVTQAMHCFLQEKKLQSHISRLEVMVGLLAAATHDLDHPGVNQGFLIATANPLAMLYKNSSVLENHHWRSAVAIIRESRVFDHLDTQIWQFIEWHLQSMILATDITRQHAFLSKLKNHIELGEMDLSLPDKRHLILQIALKCADICNPCRPPDVSKRWSLHICEEFFRQGDMEKALNVPVTAHYDRYEQNAIAIIQTGFMQYVVLPLFREWDRFQGSELSKKMLKNVISNRTSWEAKLQEAEVQIEPAPRPFPNHNNPAQWKRVDMDYDEEDKDLESRNQFILDNFGPPSMLCVPSSCQPRRHSLPPRILQNTLPTTNKQWQLRRGSFPKTFDTASHYNKRKSSIPNPISSYLCQLIKRTSFDKSSPDSQFPLLTNVDCDTSTNNSRPKTNSTQQIGDSTADTNQTAASKNLCLQIQPHLQNNNQVLEHLLSLNKTNHLDSNMIRNHRGDTVLDRPRSQSLQEPSSTAQQPKPQRYSLPGDHFNGGSSSHIVKSMSSGRNSIGLLHSDQPPSPVLEEQAPLLTPIPIVAEEGT